LRLIVVVIGQRLSNQRNVSLDVSRYKYINNDKAFIHEVPSKSVSFTQLYGTDYINIEKLTRALGYLGNSPLFMVSKHPLQ
jgi:hypothetical protein